MAIVAGIGYEGRSVEEVVDIASDAGIGLVVDVRLNPISRKPGLSKKRLSSYLAEAGISYTHVPSLGNPKDNRDAFRSGDPAARKRYEEILSNGSSSDVDHVMALASNQIVALLCYEHDVSECHRSAITEEMIRRDPSIQVTDL